MNYSHSICHHEHFISMPPKNIFICSNKSEMNLKKDFLDLNYFSTLQNLMSNIIDFSVLCQKKDYLKLRKKTILMLKDISINYCLSDKSYHLAISLLDKIYLKIKALNEINIIAIFCLILSAKFIENDPLKSSLLEKNYCNKISSNYKSDEIYILKLLDYNLNFTTAYDILKLILTQQNILFDGEEKNYKFSIYHMAIVYLNKLVENDIILSLNPIEISFGIIQLIRKRLKLIPEKKEIYSFFFKDTNKNFSNVYVIFYQLFCKKNKGKENKKKDYELEKNYQQILKQKSEEIILIV